MTATLTQNVINAPTPPVKRPIAALDAGNRTTQWIDPQNIVRTIPSCIKMLEDWEDASPDSRSILIEVLTNSGEIKERFIIGEEVQRQRVLALSRVTSAKWLSALFTLPWSLSREPTR